MAPLSVTFLDLPKSARTRILFLSNLVRPCLVNLLQEERHEGYSAYRPTTRDCLCPPLGLGILYVSKQVYEEALAVFFHSNKFFVCVSSDQSLKWLLQCQRKVLPLGRSLRIWFGKAMDGALSDKGPRGDQISALWAAACAYLGENLAPGLVHFSLRCELWSVLAAKRTARSLELLPMMASCEVRLGPKVDKTLQALARKSVQIIMKRDEAKFPIEQLPSTLRSRILYFTDLVARPQPGLHGMNGKMQIYSGKLSHQLRRCCGTCSGYDNNCLCITKPSAISNTCQCAVIPSCLFWLSRLFSEEAISVFYLENQFQFSGDPLKNLGMLKRLPDSSVKLVRYVEYKMGEDFGEKLMDPYHAIHEHWSMFISFIRDNFNLSRLYFHISTEDFWILGSTRNPGYKSAVIITALRGLQGLKGASLDIPSLSLAEREEVERVMVGPRYVPLTEEGRQRVTRGEATGY